MLRNDQRMTRNGNVEVFRCLLMFLIVAYHCFIYGSCGDSNALWTYCFTVLICWHTDGFLAISGWYGIKFKWSRFWGLIGQFAFYGCLSCVYCWIVGKNLQGVIYSFTGGWFGVYLCHATTTFGGRFYDFEGWLVNSLHLHGFFAVLLTAVFVFVVSIGVEVARKFGLRMIKARI